MAMPENPYSVLCREAATNKLLGRLDPDGYAVNRRIYAAMFTKDRAEDIAAEINDGAQFTAKAIKF